MEKLLKRVPPLTMTHIKEIEEEIKAVELKGNCLYAVPFFVNEITLNAIGITVVRTVDGGKARLGIFQNLNFDDPNSDSVYPGALIADFGEVDASTTGKKTLSTEQTLSAGLYWLVVVANSGVGIEGNTFEEGFSYVVDFQYSPLPEAFPPDATEHTGEAPAFFIGQAGE